MKAIITEEFEIEEKEKELIEQYRAADEDIKEAIKRILGIEDISN